MIRDEFIKQKKEKKLSAKAMEKIRAVGERAYYVTEINRLLELKRFFKFCVITIGILLVIVSLFLLIPLIQYKKFVSDMIVSTVILGVFWLVIILWFALFSPIITNKITRYTKEYDKIKQNDIIKQKNIYDKINK